MEELKIKKRVRDGSEEFDSVLDLPEVKKLREDLLESLSDDSEFCTTTQDLDSFMKSFEEEIMGSPASKVTETSEDLVDLTSTSGPQEAQPQLGYLLEASDDELGIPPPTASPTNARSELGRVDYDSSGLGGELWEFGGQVPFYDSFEFGIDGTEDYSNGDFVALDGLFDYSDPGCGINDLEWQPKTLPAQ